MAVNRLRTRSPPTAVEQSLAVHRTPMALGSTWQQKFLRRDRTGSLPGRPPMADPGLAVRKI